jgi:hypothetical protein
MEAFVDDTNMAINDSEKPSNLSELATTLQIDAQHREKLLFTSGRKLELSKCIFYITHWEFTEDGLPQLTPKSDIPHKFLTHQENDTEPTEIVQNNCNKYTIPPLVLLSPHPWSAICPRLPLGSHSPPFKTD